MRPDYFNYFPAVRQAVHYYYSAVWPDRSNHFPAARPVLTTSPQCGLPWWTNSVEEEKRERFCRCLAPKNSIICVYRDMPPFSYPQPPSPCPVLWTPSFLILDNPRTDWTHLLRREFLTRLSQFILG
jgi:hypothetical protein